MAQVFGEFEAAFIKWREITRTPSDIKFDTQEAYADLNAFLRWDINDRQYEIDSTRVLATTKEGQIGWVPGTSKPDDVIALSQGSPFPWFLRERDDGYYTVIGDAYIQGIMHGEAWPADGEGVHTICMK